MICNRQCQLVWKKSPKQRYSSPKLSFQKIVSLLWTWDSRIPCTGMWNVLICRIALAWSTKRETRCQRLLHFWGHMRGQEINFLIRRVDWLCSCQGKVKYIQMLLGLGVCTNNFTWNNADAKKQHRSYNFCKTNIFAHSHSQNTLIPKVSLDLVDLRSFKLSHTDFRYFAVCMHENDFFPKMSAFANCIF